MTFFNVLILSTAFTFTANSSEGEQREAIRALGKATFKQFRLDRKLKFYEEKYLSDDIREYGGWVGLIIKVSNEKRISYEWTF